MFFSQFEDEDSQSKSKLRLLKYPAGLFVPSGFDERNIENYFPECNNTLSLRKMSKCFNKKWLEISMIPY